MLRVILTAVLSRAAVWSLTVHVVSCASRLAHLCARNPRHEQGDAKDSPVVILVATTKKGCTRTARHSFKMMHSFLLD